MSGIDVLTLKQECVIWKLSQLDSTCNIGTLRLIDFDDNSHTNICDIESVIKSLNLSQSLANLTLDLNMVIYHHVWMLAIEKILLKKYYHNLQNVNLLLTISNKGTIAPLFQMLNKHCQILKYQFKQLNIGVQMWNWNSTFNKYYAFEWNTKIDQKFLNQKDKEIHYFELDVRSDDTSNKKFHQWKNKRT